MSVGGDEPIVEADGDKVEVNETVSEEKEAEKVEDATETSGARDVVSDDRIEDNVVENTETFEDQMEEAEETDAVEEAKADIEEGSK